jgi:hypothetical protein
LKGAHSSLTLFLLILIVLLPSEGVSAQSSYLPRGLNGSSFEAGISLNNWHLREVFGKLSYSIGGVLDIGAAVQYGFTSIGGASAYDVKMALHYSSIALKQDESIPISAKITGSYGFSKMGSVFLEENDLEREGLGYDIGLSLFRDFNIVSKLAVRIGILSNFHSYSYTTDLIYTPPETVVTQYPVFQREEEFYFGGELGISYQITPMIDLAMTATVMFDTDFTVVLSPNFGIITTQ